MSDARIAVTPELVGQALGAFDALEELGRGTYGTTFRAQRGEDVSALKVIHYPNLPEFLWEREITALVLVDHPNVVGLRHSGEFGIPGGRRLSYLECEFIDGGTVKQAVENGRQPETEEELRAFLAGLLAGVAEIHELGIIHRDIKPGNVALRGGDWASPVLLDFGLARVIDMSQHTVYPMAVGTVPYMSPEQLRAEPARTRSDLFSVGVVAFEAGTGTHPFGFSEDTPTTPQAIHDQILAGPILALEEREPVWSAPLRNVVLRMLSYNAHERLSVARAIRDLEGGD